MKPIVIVAIAAVAMIGVMVPSSFAFEYKFTDDFFITYDKCELEINSDDKLSRIIWANGFNDNSLDDYPFCDTFSNSKFEYVEFGNDKIVLIKTKDDNATKMWFAIFSQSNLPQNELVVILPKDWSVGDSINHFEYEGINKITINNKLIQVYEFKEITYEVDEEFAIERIWKFQYEVNSGFLVSIQHIFSAVDILRDQEGIVTLKINAIDISQKSSIASFVDQTKDPQHYIDRYNNEPAYKEWFDENYPQYSSIYQAVGLSEPVVEPVVEHTSEPVVEYTSEPVAEVTPTPNCGSGTELVNGVCQVVQTEEKSSKGGGCLIATATYGSEMSQQVQQLRELRDNQLLQTESGTSFMNTFNDIYYSFSPTIADMEREHPMFKEAVKLAITPMITSLSLMENANSESEVLGIGISVIALNFGMYLGIPAIVIVGIKKKF